MPKHNRLIVAVHGATGTQGAPVAPPTARGYYVRAVARQPNYGHRLPSGSQPFAADLSDAG